MVQGFSCDKVAFSSAHGSKLVDQAGCTGEEIVTSVKQVADIMNEITSVSSQEQSDGIEQVTQAISQIKHQTRSNQASKGNEHRESRLRLGRVLNRINNKARDTFSSRRSHDTTQHKMHAIQLNWLACIFHW